jgi:mRNA interferase RelE/StbE
MEVDPFVGDVKPIKGVRGLFRKRVGDYRIAFTLDFEKDEVAVLRIGHRSKFYD